MASFEHIYKEISQGRGMLYAWFAAMHSRVDIALCGANKEDLLFITGKIQEKINSLEKLANFFDPSSELVNLNDATAGSTTEVSEELLAMLYLSMRYNELTDGKFDICIKSSGYDSNVAKNVVINLENETLTKHRYGIRFDLSGFLKGYALDEARAILNRYGVTDVLLSIGNSSILAIGNHPYGKGWKVSYPNDDMDNVEVELYDECLTTSGNSDSNRRHIISPVNGEYVGGTGMVSVITRGGAEGEALSTAMFVERDSAKREAILGNFNGARLQTVTQN